jgi:hypothetical protein
MYARTCVWEPLYVFMEEICQPDLYQMYNMYSLRKTWNRLYIKTISPLTPKIYMYCHANFRKIITARRAIQAARARSIHGEGG